MIADEFYQYFETYVSEAGLGEDERELLESFVSFIDVRADSIESITRGMVSSEFYHFYFDYSESSDYRASRSEKQYCHPSELLDREL